MNELLKLFCLTLNGEIKKNYEVFLHVSLRRDNSRSSENRMEKGGALGLILALAREFSLEQDPFSLKLESLGKK